MGETSFGKEDKCSFNWWKDSSASLVHSNLLCFRDLKKGEHLSADLDRNLPKAATRDGNGSDLDRVKVDPDPDPFSRTGSRFRPGSASPVLQDPDPNPRILRIQYRIRVQNGSDLFLLFFFVFLNVLRLQ